MLRGRIQTIEILFSRSCAVADELAAMIRSASSSVDAALYRLNNPRLGEALREAVERGIRVRVLLDRSKFGDASQTREIVRSSRFSCRLIGGRNSGKSKLHHKFALFDGALVATGSYNWTIESETENFENLVILRDASAARAFRLEFEALWNEGAGADRDNKSRGAANPENSSARRS
jgi:mitochondrial cardiolipin hydrolase